MDNLEKTAYIDNLDTMELGAFFDLIKQDAALFLSKDKVFDNQAYEKGKAAIKQRPLPWHGSGLTEVISDIRKNILHGAVHQHNRHYMAFPDKGSSVAAQYASLLSSVTNQNVIADEKSAPTGTYVETAVISWLRELLGFKVTDAFPSDALELGGVFVPGGVLANTVALLAARQRAYPDSKLHGMQAQGRRPRVFVAGPTMSHYSHFGATWWLGIGYENVVEVACTSESKMDQNDLAAKLEECLRNGDIPVAVIALAGDSRTNVIDDIPSLYAITQKYGTWLHVDACHGGILAFDQTYTYRGRHFLSYCDSITIDPHKHLAIPYANSVVLFKNPETLAAIGSSTDITIAYGSNDIGQVTPFIGSKPFDALKLYAVMLHYGVEGIKRLIDNRRAITWHWHDLLASSAYLQPMHEPHLFAQAFSVRPEGRSLEAVAALNKQLHDVLYQRGEVVVHNFNLCDYRNALGFGMGSKVRTLGTMIGYDDYSHGDLLAILRIIEETCQEILNTTVQKELAIHS
ncbi:MAG: pyridoxal-dependent decarboxylase [Patescibacteria group bacterium]